MLYINQYYPRPGTPAAKMKRVPTRDVKQRTKQLTDLFHSYEPYRKRIGQKYQVLVTELAYDKQHYVGHNEFYEQVLLIFDISSLKNRSKINDRFFRPISVAIRLCLNLPQNRCQVKGITLMNRSEFQKLSVFCPKSKFRGKTF